MTSSDRGADVLEALSRASHDGASASVTTVVTGNEVYLLVANRRARRPADRKHPLGHGREAYVWSLLAALGLFVAGAAVSVAHGVQELFRPEPATDFALGYVVLAFSFVLEGISFLRSLRQTRPAAQLFERDVIEQVMATRSDAASRVRRGCRGPARPRDRVRRVSGTRGHRLGDAGRRRIDPRRPAARRRRLDPHQPEPPVPDRRRARPADPFRRDPVAARHARGGARDVPATGVRRPASGAVAGAVFSLSAPDEPSLQP